MKQLFFLLFCLFLIIACKKQVENTNQTDDNPAGKVVDAVTGEPVAHAYVALFKSGDVINPKGTMVASMYTDASGSFAFDANLGGTDIQAAKDRYYDSELKALADSKYRQTKKLEIVPEAFFRVHIRNVDKIYTELSLGPFPKDKFYGLDIDTSVVIKGQANYNQFDYRLINDTGSILKTIITQPIRFDTINININY